MALDIYFSALFFLTGIVIGSFLNVCIYRLPREVSVVSPPSACPVCSHRLKAIDLIPILSFFSLRGKCRYCGTGISIRYPIIELITGLIYLAMFLTFGLTISTALNLVFASVLVLVFFVDYDHRIILDRFWITILVAAILKLFIPLLNPGSTDEISASLNKFYTFAQITDLTGFFIGGLVGGGALLLIGLVGKVIFRKESMGFGDVKLMFATGFFLRTSGTIAALLFAIWVAGIAGVILLRIRKDKTDIYMPFGPYLALCSLLSLFFGEYVVNWYVSSFF